MFEPVHIFGVPVVPWTASGLIDSVLLWASGADEHKTILYANVHVLNSAYANPALQRELRRASTVYCDGSGVRLGATILGSSLPHRITGADWIHPFCENAAHRGVGVYLLGGQPGVAKRAGELLIHQHARLQVRGTHHGYLDEAASERVLTEINRSGAAVLLVGMGTPRQEFWISRHRDRLTPPVVWAVGALFDFITGVEPRGLRWMVDHHLEWVARLAANPRRHWKRYLLGNPMFVARVVRERFYGLPRRLERA